MRLTALRRTVAPVAVVAAVATAVGVACRRSRPTPLDPRRDVARDPCRPSGRQARWNRHDHRRPSRFAGHRVAGRSDPSPSRRARKGADFVHAGRPPRPPTDRGGLREAVTPGRHDALPLALRRRHRHPAEHQRGRHRPRAYAAAPRQPSGSARRCRSERSGQRVVPPERRRPGDRAPARALGPAPPPHRAPGVPRGRQRRLDLRRRPSDAPPRRGHLQGGAHRRHGVPAGLPRDTDPAALAQRPRADRLPPRRVHHRRPDPHAALKCFVIACLVNLEPSVNSAIECRRPSESFATSANRVVSPNAANSDARSRSLTDPVL